MAGRGLHVILFAAVMAALAACGSRLPPLGDAARARGFLGPPTALSRSGSGGRTRSQTDGTVGTAGSKGGASQGSAASKEPAREVRDPGVGDDFIRIGQTAPISGLLGIVGEQNVAGLDSYFKMTNERGGVNGKKLQLVSYDDRLEPAQVLSNVKRLVEEDKTFLSVAYLSDSALAYVEQKHVPLIMYGGTALPFSSRFKWSIPLNGHVVSWDQDLAVALRDHFKIRPKRVAILYDTNLFNEEPAVPFFKRAWKAVFPDVEIVSTHAVNLTDLDCSAVAAKMKALDVEFWDFTSIGYLHCISAMERIGWKPRLGMGGWPTSDGNLGAIVGPALDGLYGMSNADQPQNNGAPRGPSEGIREYANACQRFNPRVCKNDINLESPDTEGYWIAGRLIVEGLRAIAPNYTREAWLAWVHSLKNWDTGISPPVISFRQDCKAGTGRSWWARWQWDKQTNSPRRSPQTPYVGGEVTAAFGGPCQNTIIADQMYPG